MVHGQRLRPSARSSYQMLMWRDLVGAATCSEIVWNALRTPIGRGYSSTATSIKQQGQKGQSSWRQKTFKNMAKKKEKPLKRESTLQKRRTRKMEWNNLKRCTQKRKYSEIAKWELESKMIEWVKQMKAAFGASFLWLVCLIYFTQVRIILRLFLCLFTKSGCLCPDILFIGYCIVSFSFSWVSFEPEIFEFAVLGSWVRCFSLILFEDIPDSRLLPWDLFFCFLFLANSRLIRSCGLNSSWYDFWQNINPFIFEMGYIVGLPTLVSFLSLDSLAF